MAPACAPSFGPSSYRDRLLPLGSPTIMAIGGPTRTYSARPVVASRANRSTSVVGVTVVGLSAACHDAGSSCSPHPAVLFGTGEADGVHGSGVAADCRVHAPSRSTRHASGTRTRPSRLGNKGRLTVQSMGVCLLAPRDYEARPPKGAGPRKKCLLDSDSELLAGRAGLGGGLDDAGGQTLLAFLAPRTRVI